MSNKGLELMQVAAASAKMSSPDLRLVIWPVGVTFDGSDGT